MAIETIAGHAHLPPIGTTMVPEIGVERAEEVVEDQMLEMGTAAAGMPMVVHVQGHLKSGILATTQRAGITTSPL